MFSLCWRTLRAQRWFAWLATGMVLSSVGSGLTFVVVYGELLRLGAPASSLALAFALTTVPAVLGSTLGERACARFAPARVLLASELLGLAGLFAPIWGVATASVSVLQWADAGPAFASGLAWPAFNLIAKRRLRADQLPAATLLQTFAFAGNVLFGVGLGGVLYGRVSVAPLLGVDAGSYLLAALAFARADGHAAPADTATVPPLRWRALPPPRQRALLLLPALALVGAPAMALLPALAPRTGATLALPLLFARSLGQLCGPLLLSARSLATRAGDNRLLLACLAGFLLCYTLLPLAGVWGLLLVFAAHVLSNVVFTLGSHGLLTAFAEADVAAASARASQMQVLLAGVSALGAGWLADRLGAWPAMSVCSGAGWLVAAWLLRRHAAG